jgi:dimethylglycine dehydrogenase
MKSQARVVVIGGGIAGCSTLYHLTQEGWSDVVLIERDELTSGTTWHSAAQVTNFGMSQVLIGLKSHSIKLYQDLAADPEYPVGYNYGDGGIRLANSQVHMDGYKHFVSVAKGMGVDFEVLDAEECARRHPLISTDNMIGGLWDPSDGHIDPAQLCQALARRARTAGAEVYRFTSVIHLTQHADDSWTVHTDKGDIRADIVVNACGYRVNEVGAMMGVEHPVASMEHQYFITDDMPGVMEAGHRIPLLRCPISDYYCRQEKNGLLVGFYEQDCKTWGMDGIDPKFTNDLCPDDLDRVMDVLEGAIERMPALAEVGIKKIVNGPITYTIDGVPLVGPIPGKRNAFCIIGLRAGLGEGGGHGWLLAQQIVHGEACYDTWALDPRRFTGHTTQELTSLYAIQDYQNEFRFHLPHEYRQAGRPAKTTPLTLVLEQAGAHFSVVNGWERSDYFKPTADFTETYGYTLNEVHEVVAAEVAMVQNGVGLAEVNGFNRIEITGEGASDWLDYMICSRVPRKLGKVGLGYLLNNDGNVKAEATIANLPDGRIWYGSAAAAEFHDMDWLTEHLPGDGSVQLRSLTNDYTILVLAGPQSRDVLSACSRGDWSAKGFPWLRVREARIGHAPAMVMSVSFSGELAYEIHVPNASLYAAYLALMKAGANSKIGHFGARAIDSMRMEKGYLHWKSDLITEFDPFETSLDRFVHMDKEFHGKAALLARDGEKRRVLRMLEVGATHACPHPSDSLYSGGKLVGSITSAEWGHRTGKNIAYAFLKPEITGDLMVDIIGKPYSATLLDEVLYDPSNNRVKL